MRYYDNEDDACNFINFIIDHDASDKFDMP
jgi:hypothetical protein